MGKKWKIDQLPIEGPGRGIGYTTKLFPLFLIEGFPCDKKKQIYFKIKKGDKLDYIVMLSFAGFWKFCYGFLAWSGSDLSQGSWRLCPAGWRLQPFKSNWETLSHSLGRTTWEKHVSSKTTTYLVTYLNILALATLSPSNNPLGFWRLRQEPGEW